MHTRIRWPITALELSSALPRSYLHLEGSHTRQVRLGLLDFEQSAVTDPVLPVSVNDITEAAYELDALIVRHFTNMPCPTAALRQTPWTERGLLIGYLKTFLQWLLDTEPPGNTWFLRSDRFSSMGMRTMQDMGMRTMQDAVTVMWNLYKIRGVPPPQGGSAEERELFESLKVPGGMCSSRPMTQHGRLQASNAALGARCAARRRHLAASHRRYELTRPVRTTCCAID